MASRPPSRSRRCRLQLKVSKKEYLVCQPISHQHGLVEVTSPLRFPSAYEGPDGNIITVEAKRCRCAEVFFQSDGLCSISFQPYEKCFVFSAILGAKIHAHATVHGASSEFHAFPT